MGRVTSAAARSMMHRTGLSLIPMVCMLVTSAPNQWVKLIISGPAMPGKRYLAPPEKPATSWGKTGPQISKRS